MITTILTIVIMFHDYQPGTMTIFVIFDVFMDDAMMITIRVLLNFMIVISYTGHQEPTPLQTAKKAREKETAGHT